MRSDRGSARLLCVQDPNYPTSSLLVGGKKPTKLLSKHLVLKRWKSHRSRLNELWRGQSRDQCSHEPPTNAKNCLAAAVSDFADSNETAVSALEGRWPTEPEKWRILLPILLCVGMLLDFTSVNQESTPVICPAAYNAIAKAISQQGAQFTYDLRSRQPCYDVSTLC